MAALILLLLGFAVLFLAALVDTREPDPAADAVFYGKRAVLAQMKDPDSAEFGAIWGARLRRENDDVFIACGYVNGRNGFGGMTGSQRFVVVGDIPMLEENAKAMVEEVWATSCIARKAG